MIFFNNFTQVANTLLGHGEISPFRVGVTGMNMISFSPLRFGVGGRV